MNIFSLATRQVIGRQTTGDIASANVLADKPPLEAIFLNKKNAMHKIGTCFCLFSFSTPEQRTKLNKLLSHYRLVRKCQVGAKVTYGEKSAACALVFMAFLYFKHTGHENT